MRLARLSCIPGACLLITICIATNAVSQPQTVPRLRDHPMDKASYVALANQWREHIEKHGETADALVNLGMAQRYSGEMEAAKLAGKRAIELEPDNPKALDFYAEVIMLDGREDEAMKLLERARAIEPDYGDVLTSLAVIYLRTGDLDKAAATLKTMFDRRAIPRPLQDFAYNMLIGLPAGAVLITNGDNDTFPPLALQAGMDFRTDVAVINRHLLRVPAYLDALSRRHPSLKTTGPSKGEAASEDPAALIRRWIKESRAPIYLAVSVDRKDLGLEAEPVCEGLCLRTAGKGLTPEEAARLVLEKYRLDSATDWSFAWDLTPAHSNMMANYVASMADLSQQDGVSTELKCRLLERAAGIAEFHDHDTEGHVKALLKKCGKS